MTTLLHDRPIEDPADVMTKLDALKDAVDSLIQTFEVQFGIQLHPEGMPGRPDPEGVLYGSTLALTNEAIGFQYACFFREEVGEQLTRVLFALDDDEATTMEDLGDALNEIPNVAAGVWKAKREVKNEAYQLGLPIFMKGNAWIKYCPRGVNALSQKLVGPDGVELQVALIWRYTEQTGGILSMTSETISNAPAHANGPAQVLQESVQAVVDTCRIQMQIECTVDPHPSDPRDADVNYGSSIALTSETGGWQLAVMANRDSCQILTRALFAMEPDEEAPLEDVADSVGEIVNVAAGVLKSSRAAAGQQVQLGLPMFMEGKSCLEFFATGIHGMAQTVQGPDDLEFHVILIWQEG